MLGRFLHGWFNRSGAARELNEEGIQQWGRGELALAEASFRSAIATRAGYAAAHSNLGMVLAEQRRFEEGLRMLQSAVAIDPRHAGARVNLANTLAFDGQVDAALEQFEAALEIDPLLGPARLNAVKPWLDTCDWRREDEVKARLCERALVPGVDWTGEVLPFVSLLLELPWQTQLAVARAHAGVLSASAARDRPAIEALRPAKKNGDRVHIAYASGDLRNNAVGHQIAGMFDAHDRRCFMISAYSWGVDDGSEWRRRIEAGCDKFVDIRDQPFSASARRIAGDGVDVLISLAGYGGSARNEIFALRPAPVQIQWLGYPGSMGADFIDYVVADNVVLPPALEPQFSEAVARLPRSYQVNDDRQNIAGDTGSRASFGLPEDAFVFCAFNQSYKIDRAVYACWMRILSAIPGAVLWLMAPEGRARLNLSAAARAGGIDEGRLVYAAALPKALHLARHGLADLFLDTWRINGGTTASDALWAGLPVLTLAGNRFGQRVAASLLHEMHLDELIARNAREYEDTAIALARDGEALGLIKARLREARDRGSLFDTAGFTGEFERALEKMVERARGGAKPETFDA